MSGQSDFWDYVRGEIIGRSATIETPFGVRMMTYADYTASGRGVGFVERYMENALEHYGNTHTEDDATGVVTGERLHAAEATIKRLVNAGDEYKIIAVGAGTTAAVHRLHQILGIYLPPAAKDTLAKQLSGYFSRKELGELTEYLTDLRPVVFVGPYEHHSNEVSWRECWVDVVEIDLTEEGLIDLNDLEAKVSADKYRHRRRFGAFSAASNVSGVKTPVYDVARILHKHGALAFFDFAAIAPYAKIDVNLDGQAFFDAIYFSPHKYLGGPGSSGVLIIHERIYRSDLPPTVGAGGTVDYVWADGQDYNPDVEAREKAGTPGILQTMRAALAMELKRKLDPDRIGLREDALIARSIELLGSHAAIEVIGPLDPKSRIAILSFNIRSGKSYFHPRYVTVLLNDLFGIQSRAGCSCAGPYGHRLLHLDEHQSKVLRRRIARGEAGLRPGWVRVNFHFLMTDEEFDFLCQAILFVADYGRYFLPLYTFDVRTGGWRHREWPSPGAAETSFCLDAALEIAGIHGEPSSVSDGSNVAGGASSGGVEDPRQGYLASARELGEKLKAEHGTTKLKTTERDLIPFVYV